MIKLMYQDFEDMERIKEMECSTLHQAMFHAKYLQSSVRGQVIKIIDGEKTYSLQDVIDYWKIDIEAIKWRKCQDG